MFPLTLTLGVWRSFGRQRRWQNDAHAHAAASCSRRLAKSAPTGFRSIVRRGVSRQSGYLPQEFGFYPSFTVRDYLDYMAALKGIGNVTHDATPTTWLSSLTGGRAQKCIAKSLAA